MYRSPLLLLCATALCGAHADTNRLAKLKPVPACAALVAAAHANRIPLDGLDPAADAERLDSGDSISALVTMFEKGTVKNQWLIYLEAVAPNAEERAQKPASPMVLYSSYGGTQACVSAPAFVVVRTLGPFVESVRAKPAKPPEKKARFSLNKGFLRLGLHHAAAAFHALDRGPVHGTWAVSNAPFSEAQLAEGRKVAAKLQLTAEQEAAMMGAIPALLSYFEVVQNTPGLSDILFEILDLPSAWSLLRNGGIKSVGIQFRKGGVPTTAASWGLSDSAPAYLLPLVVEMNCQPALNLTLVVTSPASPLLACAGVVGLLAERPGDPAKYLTLRIVSARRAKSL